MSGDIIATVLTGAAVLIGVWRFVEGMRCDLSAQVGDVRRDLSAQIAAVNGRIDAILLADRKGAPAP